jgi:hypothetical protein
MWAYEIDRELFLRGLVKPKINWLKLNSMINAASKTKNYNFFGYAMHPCCLGGSLYGIFMENFAVSTDPVNVLASTGP